jgi:hypothetical protein
VAQVLDGICTDYGMMPHELLEGSIEELSLAIRVREKARAK